MFSDLLRDTGFAWFRSQPRDGVKVFKLEETTSTPPRKKKSGDTSKAQNRPFAEAKRPCFLRMSIYGPTSHKVRWKTQENAGKRSHGRSTTRKHKKTILSRVPLSAHRDVYDEINCNTSKALHEQHAWNSCMAISSSSWSLSALCRLPLS